MADFAAAANTPQKDESDAIGAAAREQLRQFVARIERLEEEKASLAADIKEVYAEAKSFGYDTKVLRKVVSIRKQDRQEREEMEALLELYLGAIGE
ncbi:MAG: DUF2312 domain-containing protein [Oceanicaulis sp.]|jgi:uncharacterized protein (UPF0335 family)